MLVISDFDRSVRPYPPCLDMYENDDVPSVMLNSTYFWLKGVDSCIIEACTTLMLIYIVTTVNHCGERRICHVSKIYRGQLLGHTTNNFFVVCHPKNARQMLDTCFTVCFIVTR